MVAPAALRLLPHPASTLPTFCKTEVMKGMCPTCYLELAVVAVVAVVPAALHPPSLEAAAMGVLAVQAVLEAAPATPFKA